MSSWKDTVMSYDKMMDIEEAVEDAVFLGQETDAKPLAIAKVQAEITWDKAIREVVEWINLEVFENSSGYIFGDEEVFSTKTFHTNWRAKLKEWGLND